MKPLAWAIQQHSFQLEGLLIELRFSQENHFSLCAVYASTRPPRASGIQAASSASGYLGRNKIKIIYYNYWFDLLYLFSHLDSAALYLFVFCRRGRDIYDVAFHVEELCFRNLNIFEENAASASLCLLLTFPVGLNILGKFSTFSFL